MQVDTTELHYLKFYSQLPTLSGMQTPQKIALGQQCPSVKVDGASPGVQTHPDAFSDCRPHPNLLRLNLQQEKGRDGGDYGVQKSLSS